MQDHPRLKIYDDARVAVVASVGIVPTAAHRAAVQKLLDDTGYEDQWLERTHFLNGNHGLLLRSMLSEQGTTQEQSIEPHLGDLRAALKAFVQGEPLPEPLRYTAQVAIDFHRRVAVWQESVRDMFAGLLV